MRSAGPCCVCKSEIWIEDGHYDSARRSEKIVFWCPYGHAQHFKQGETDEQKVRRENQRLLQQIAQKDDEIKFVREQANSSERRRAAAVGVATRIKNRVGHGVCPCCTRTFQNLSKHMQNQHPGYAKEQIPEAAE